MINGVNMKINIDEYIMNALKEDITSEDVTTNAIIKEARKGKAQLICKEDGILCGIDVFERVFKLLDNTSYLETEYKDGDQIKKGDLVGIIHGDIRGILSGERTALNYLGHMCGIATKTREMVDVLKDYDTVLLDTRKTTPNMRPFDKYAVTIGGGKNHRYNLSDGILIKDNHIDAAGSITKAIERTREYAPFVRKIEVETENIEMVKEAVAAKADIIMLDNMSNEEMKKAVEYINGRALTECSGNVNKERLIEIAKTGVDYVSCGALTHTVKCLDLSLKNLSEE